MSKSSFYFRPRSSGHLASSKRFFGGLFTKKSRKNAILHELQQFRTIVRSGKFISTIFAYLEHFAWLCKSFAWSCEINFLFIGQGQVDTWHYLRDLPEASSLRNLEFSNKIVILHKIQQFCMIVQNQKCNNSKLRLLGAFRTTVWNFCMIMQNQP